MRILLSWLEDFVEIRESLDALAEALTMAGLAVDEVDTTGGETVFELDITANRPDAMNHLGIAREISALYGRPLKRPATEIPEVDPPAAERAAIEILDPDLCARYSGRVALGVEVKASPPWMRKRIELCGIRSINNIADLTNYVLLEMGHPTHAFDLDLLADSKIIVRRARPGETLRTLDGVNRELGGEHLVIADGRRPVALAGVMGGEESEISGKTRNVLFEAAWFLPGSIRGTSRHFGIHTDASHRFERGADVEATAWAADRLASLLGKASPGSVLRGVVDTYARTIERPRILLRRSTLKRILGVDVPDEEVVRILAALEFPAEEREQGWEIAPPTHRLDVEREIDLVEEVARIHGYDKLPLHLPEGSAAPAEAPFAAEERVLRATARSLGYDETIAFTFISSAEAQQFGFGDPVPLRNPLSETQDVLRNTSVPSMLRALEWNLNRNETNVRLMEIGHLYRGGQGEYEEPHVLTLGATGLARPESIGDGGKPFDFYELKSDVEALLAHFDVRLSYEPTELPPYYLAGQAARAADDGRVLAYFGEVDPKSLEGRKIRQPAFIAEIFLDPLKKDSLKKDSLRRPHYEVLPRVPAVHRDFSLFVPEGTAFRDIRAAVGEPQFLVTLEPWEVFRGAQVPDGFYSLLLRAAWQKMTESLTDEEVNGYAERLLSTLADKLKIRQRV